MRMLFTQYMLLHVPSAILGVLIVASLVFLSIIGLLGVRRVFSHQKLKIHNDVAGAIFGTLGMAYTVLLAFVVVVVWQAYDLANTNVGKEANMIGDLYRDSQSFKEPGRSQIRALLQQYRDSVVQDEWPALATGSESPKVTKIMDALTRAYAGYTVDTMSEQIFFQESIRRLNSLYDLRNDRVVASTTGIHPLLWFVLIFGGVATVAFVFFFGSEDLQAQIGMTMLLASLIGLILLTVLVFDFPFTGDISVSSRAFSEIAFH